MKKKLFAVVATLLLAPTVHASPVSLNLTQTPTNCLSISASGGKAAACGTAPQSFNIVSVTGGLQLQDVASGTCIQATKTAATLNTCVTSTASNYNSQVFTSISVTSPAGKLYKSTDGSGYCLNASTTLAKLDYCDAVHYSSALFSPTAACNGDEIDFNPTVYTVTEPANGTSNAVLTVTRKGCATNAARVAFNTNPGTAVSPTNYSGQSGNLSWAAGNNSSQQIAVPITSTPFAGSLNFSVVLKAPAGGTGGATIGTSTAAVTINGSQQASPGVTVGTDAKLHDQTGAVLRLTGVNVAQLEQATQCGVLDSSGNSPCSDYWRGTPPNFTAMKGNVLRLPLNESSWLGGTCAWYDYNSGKQTGTINADPFGNYKATVDNFVSNATAAGYYVILDLHWSAPGTFCAQTQNPMPDADHSVTFWNQIATRYKAYPNVIFDLFNEPYVFQYPLGSQDGLFQPCDATHTTNCVQLTNTYDKDGIDLAFDKCVTNGCTASYVMTNIGPKLQVPYVWQTAGMQQLVSAIRSTGATNVIMVPSNGYTYRLYTMWGTSWATQDSLNPAQLAADWHVYSSATNPYPSPGNDYFDGTGPVDLATYNSVVTAHPVVLGETGENTNCEPQQANCNPVQTGKSAELEWDRWWIGGTGGGAYASQPGTLAEADSLCMNTVWWAAMSAGGYPGPIWDVNNSVWSWDVYAKYLQTWPTFINRAHTC